MQAVNGYLSNGWFTPNDGVVLPSYARVRLVIEEVINEKNTEEPPKPRLSDAEKQARIDWLNRIEKMLELSGDEDLSNFPEQGMMKVSYDDWLNSEGVLD